MNLNLSDCKWLKHNGLKQGISEYKYALLSHNKTMEIVPQDWYIKTIGVEYVDILEVMIYTNQIQTKLTSETVSKVEEIENYEKLRLNYSGIFTFSGTGSYLTEYIEKIKLDNK